MKVEFDVSDTAVYLLEEMLEEEVTEEVLEEYLKELLQRQIIHHHSHIQKGDLL